MRSGMRYYRRAQPGRPLRLLRRIGLVIVALIVAIAAIEIQRIVIISLALQRMAFWAVRYAVSDNYIVSYCATSAVSEWAAQTLPVDYQMATFTQTSATGVVSLRVDPQTLVALDQSDGVLDCLITYPGRESISHGTDIALSYSLENAARYFSIRQITDEVTPPIIDKSLLRMAMCSDRPGYHYDAGTNTCSPFDDPGRFSSGDKFYIVFTYRYSFGSWLGLKIATIPLSATLAGVVEEFR